MRWPPQSMVDLLSGILKCPVCGGSLYGNVSRKRNAKGEAYKDYFYYACKHRLHTDGHRCDYHKQWLEEKVDAAVEEVIYKLVQNPKFEQIIKEKIGAGIDTDQIELETETLRKKIRQMNGAKNKLAEQMDLLDITDRLYNRKYQDMQTRLYGIYDEIMKAEDALDELQARMANIRQQKISGDSVYQFLLYFDKLYSRFSDSEKKAFLNSFIERVDIYPQPLPDGRFLKHIKFRFPVFFNGVEVQDISWENENSVECVVLLTSC